MMSGILVCGYYGMQNAGDDAFCVVAAEAAHEIWGAEAIAFHARQSRLPVLPRPARGTVPDPPRIRGHARIASVVAAVRAKHVVHVGGSTFHSMTGLHRDLDRLASLGQVSLGAIGVSVGPFEAEAEGRRVVRYLRRFRRLHVRDSASVDRIRAVDPTLAVQRGFDVAVLLPTLPFCQPVFQGTEARSRPEVPILGISVCRDGRLRGRRSDAEERREERLIETLREVARDTPVRFRFIVFNGHPQWGDEALSQRMARAVSASAPVEVMPYTGDVRDTLRDIAGCDAVLGVRLHSAIFAYSCGVPFAIVAYQRKSVEFAADVGLPDEFLFGVTGPDRDQGAEAIRRLLAPGATGVLPALPLQEAQRLAASGLRPDLWDQNGERSPARQLVGSV